MNYLSQYNGVSVVCLSCKPPNSYMVVLLVPQYLKLIGLLIVLHLELFCNLKSKLYYLKLTFASRKFFVPCSSINMHSGILPLTETILIRIRISMKKGTVIR